MPDPREPFQERLDDRMTAPPSKQWQQMRADLKEDMGLLLEGQLLRLRTELKREWRQAFLNAAQHGTSEDMNSLREGTATLSHTPEGDLCPAAIDDAEDDDLISNANVREDEDQRRAIDLRACPPSADFDLGEEKATSIGLEMNRTLTSTEEVRKSFQTNTFWRWMAYQFTPPPTFSKKKAKQNVVRQVVEGVVFSWITGLGIVINTVYLGIYADFTIVNELERLGGADAKEGWWVAPRLFEAWFLIELVIRILAYRWEFLTGKQRIYNILDLFVVLVPFFSFAMLYVFTPRDHTTIGLNGLSVLRAIRIVRLVHTFELFRLPFFAEFRMIINSILLSLPSFLWSIIIASFSLYVSSTAILLGIGIRLQELDVNSSYDMGTVTALGSSWNSLQQTLLNLFMSITNGVDWSVLWASISKLHFGYQFGFLMYIVLMLFLIFNVIAGMFIERAFRVINNDRDFWIIEEQNQHRMYKERLLGLFDELDMDENAHIAWEEFEHHLGNPYVKAYFSWLGIDVSGAWDLFHLIDANKDGGVTVEEFMEGCMELKGPATNIELRVLHKMFEEYTLQSAEDNYMNRDMSRQVTTPAVRRDKTQKVNPYRGTVRISTQTRVSTMIDDDITGRANASIISRTPAPVMTAEML